MRADEKFLPIDLHLDEDARMSLLPNEFKEREALVMEVVKKTEDYKKEQKRINKAIKTLKNRLPEKKTKKGKDSIKKEIEDLKKQKPVKPRTLITKKMVEENRLVEDLTFSPAVGKLPEKSDGDVFVRTSSSDERFIKKYAKDIKKSEVLTKKASKSVALKKAERKYQFKNGLGVSSVKKQEMKDFDEDTWVVIVCRMAKAIPTLVELTDIEIKKLVYSSPQLSERGFSVVRQMEAILDAEYKKEQYLNILVLNKQFEGLIETKMEEQVFRCVLQRVKTIKAIESQKVRTAYRVKKNLINRLKNYCIKNGWDKNWFFEHFGELPPVKYCVKMDEKKQGFKDEYREIC